jgi:peptide/nickel transport system permease protein
VGRCAVGQDGWLLSMSVPTKALENSHTPPGKPETEQAIQGRSLGALAWRRLRRDKFAMAGMVVIVLLILLAIFGPLLNKALGQDPNQFHSNLINGDTGQPKGSFGGSSPLHPLGVEPINGRDVLARLIAGARTSLEIAMAAMFLSLVLGLGVGVAAGYFRGAVDAVLSRIMDILLAFPTLLFSIALLGVFSQIHSFAGLSGTSLNIAIVIFVIGFFGFAYLGRIVRGQVISLREKEFVDAARSLGATNWRILTREIAPNIVGPVLVWISLSIPSYILSEAGLSYLGVGVQPPTASWGQMMSRAGNYFQIDPTYLLWPGLTIFITVLAFNLFGDGLRDAFDPRSDR